jgi:high affinity Mn2+ porin
MRKSLWASSAPMAMVIVHVASSAAAEPASQMGALAELPYNWTGMYVGGHMAYSEGRTRNTLFDPEPTDSSNAFGSLYGGVQIGYNYLLPSRILLGVEADISFPYFLEGSDVVSTRATAQGAATETVDFVSTLRGRVGYAFDHWMIYGTGGLTWLQGRFGESPGTVSEEDVRRRIHTGWSVGAGAEVPVAPNWTARLEYIYGQFGGAIVSFPSGTRFESTMDEHSFRLGVNRQLGSSGETVLPSQRNDGLTTNSGDWSIHGQFTFVQQGYPSFHSPYAGVNSLQGNSQENNTISATAFVGYRPWAGTEFYVNPELMQGVGLSDVHGLAGFPNGEAQKAGFPAPRLDVARLFVRQTIGLGGEQETIEDGPNQIGGKQDISRITITAGRLAVTDVFDVNAYANDPRRDFLNWNAYGGGSYDWTMDKISYTWGGIVDLNQKYWALRLGYFLLPVVSNVNTYDTHIPERGEYTTELELRYSLLSQAGKLRLFGWVNQGTMGSYSDALAMPVATPGYPDITLTRRQRTNYGFVVNAEQALTSDLGLFARASWSPGQVEIIGWTDCAEALTVGTVLKGTSWGRKDDRIGVAGVAEGLSREARAYFAAGGLGILIGDGRLNYRPEQILESYYAYSLNKWTTITGDYQLIYNPGYNAARGPASIFALRLHAEF